MQGKRHRRILSASQFPPKNFLEDCIATQPILIAEHSYHRLPELELPQRINEPPLHRRVFSGSATLDLEAVMEDISLSRAEASCASQQLKRELKSKLLEMLAKRDSDAGTDRVPLASSSVHSSGTAVAPGAGLDNRGVLQQLLLHMFRQEHSAKVHRLIQALPAGHYVVLLHGKKFKGIYGADAAGFVKVHGNQSAPGYVFKHLVVDMYKYVGKSLVKICKGVAALPDAIRSP